MHTCEFCGSTFICSSSLKLHLKTAKYCLKLQNIEPAIRHICDYCQKEYSTSNTLKEHSTRCAKKRKIEEATSHNQLIEMYEAKLRDLAEHKDAEIAYLKQQLEKRMDDITDIARQTKTKTTNIVVNQTGFLNLKDTDSIHNLLVKHVDDSVLAEGQKGLAKMLTRTLLSDENGHKLYQCTDRSRQQFEFMDVDGNLIRDAKGNQLKSALIESNLRDVAYENGERMWRKEDGSRDIQRFMIFSDKVKEVAELDQDDTKFRSELSTLLS